MFQLVEALDLIRWAHRTSNVRRAPRVLWDAVVSLVTDSENPFTPLASCLYTLSRLDRTRFPQYPWQDLYHTWGASERELLARELGRDVYESDRAKRMACDLLLDLTQDSHYHVRRAAYRGLRRLDSLMYRQLCLTWIAAPEPELRQRAAEACIWLDGHTEACHDPVGLIDQLSADCEPGVRQAAQHAQDERRRNDWAAIYLHRVTGTDDESNQSILDRWVYASALAAVASDDAILELDSYLHSRNWAPHVRHWLGRLRNEMERQWTEHQKTCPEPWPDWGGPLG